MHKQQTPFQPPNPPAKPVKKHYFCLMNQELTLRVQQALDTMRPFLKADGGDAQIIDVIKGLVRIKLLGTCSTCDLSKMTMKAGIEQAIIKAVPEIKSVEAIY